MTRWLANAIGFQLVWLAAVGGAAQGWWWSGPLAVAVFASLQLAHSTVARADARLMLIAAALGFALDSFWVQTGLLRFSAPLPWPQVAPPWIVALWMGFALTFNHSLAAFKSRPVLAAAFGVFGAPLSYVAAERLGAVILTEPRWTTFAALAFAWGLLTPLMLRLASLRARPMEVLP